MLESFGLEAPVSTLKVQSLVVQNHFASNELQLRPELYRC